MELVLDQKDVADWVYRGEGAANLVLAYNGSSPNFVGKVLRVPKAQRNKSSANGNNDQNGHSALTTDECYLWRDTEDILSAPTREIAQQVYARCILSPILGSRHVDAGMRVIVSKEFLESLEKNVVKQRPSRRVGAAKVNSSSFALLMSDHSVFPSGDLKEKCSLSVEIKPKCGFLPVSRFISDGNSVKKRVARFKMHQYLKLHQREISEISKYDPLDLFSGTKEGVNKAIKSLFATPQNNFRVFLNGSLIFGASGCGADSTSSLAGEAFEDILKFVIKADDGQRTKNFLSLVAEAAFRSGLLDRLLKVQKLDKFDIEGAIHAYYDIVSQPCVVCRSMGQESLSGRYSYLHAMTLDEKLKIVRDYMVAATAKDLSMIISFRDKEDGEDSESEHSSLMLESINQEFDYKAAFIDLDMKPLKKMEYYYQLDQKIVCCYKQMMNVEKRMGKTLANGLEYSDQCNGIDGLRILFGTGYPSFLTCLVGLCILFGIGYHAAAGPIFLTQPLSSKFDEIRVNRLKSPFQRQLFELDIHQRRRHGVIRGFPLQEK